MTINYQPIGTIHSPFKALDDMPIQPSGAVGVCGTIELHPDYLAGLDDLDGFSHIILLYDFHLNDNFKLKVTPFLNPGEKGVFATRAPKRPNSIGLSIVRLEKIEGCCLTISNVDILDGTPLLDIKPYVPSFDAQTDVKSGWLESSGEQVKKHRSDDRFMKD